MGHRNSYTLTGPQVDVVLIALLTLENELLDQERSRIPTERQLEVLRRAREALRRPARRGVARVSFPGAPPANN